jgi:hypothetical protein
VEKSSAQLIFPQGGTMIKIADLLVMAVVVALLSSCGPWREQRKPKAQSSETPKIESTFPLTLVPVADGGAYAVDELYGVVWYVSNGKAIRISDLKADFIHQIAPAVEGGAYIHVLTKDKSSALWYLKAETATKIQEGTSVTQFKEKPRLTESWLWAMWQSERMRRQKEEDKEKE